MRLVLLLSLLGLTAAINLPPTNIQDITLREGQNYTIKLPPLLPTARVGWYFAGGYVPCLQHKTCEILRKELHFKVVLLSDSGLYTALVNNGPESQVYFFNVSVQPTTVNIDVPKMEFFTLIPPTLPPIPFTFYHYEASTWRLVMKCEKMPNRVHCHEPKNDCYYREGPHKMLEGLAMQGCDGLYMLNATDYQILFNVNMYLTNNKTERAVLGNLFFLIIDDVQGSFPYRWFKGDELVCEAQTIADFHCVESKCDYDGFDQFSIWGTMSRDCAGIYTFTHQYGNVTYYLELDVKTSKRVIAEPNEKVILGKRDLAKAYFTWYFNGNRIAFCVKEDNCEWLEPYGLGKGSTLVFNANPSLAGEYFINYNDSEWEGTYHVEVKLPVPTPRPKSIILADLPKSYRKVKEGGRAILTPPNTEYGVLWYYFASEFEFQKVASFVPHRPVIVHHDYFDLQGNKLVIKKVNERTSGIYLAMSEQTKHVDYNLKLFAVTNTNSRSMLTASQYNKLVYNIKKTSPSNATFSLYKESKGNLDFVQHCHLTECYDMAGPGKSFIMSPFYGQCTLVAYYFQKRNHEVDHHPSAPVAPGRKLLQFTDSGSGSGDFFDDDDDDYDVYLSSRNVHQPSGPHPGDYIFSYFVFLSVLLFWFLLMCMGGRLIYLCCKKQRVYFPEELGLMKTTR